MSTKFASRHYVEIADAIARLVNRKDLPKATAKRVANEFKDVFRCDNGRFNSDRFDTYLDKQIK